MQRVVTVSNNGIPRDYRVERQGVGPVTNPFGHFVLAPFTVSDEWRDYVALVRAPMGPNWEPIWDNTKPVWVRIDSGCLTGQVFGDDTCECREQLQQAMETLGRDENEQGVIIQIPHQDGRGRGLAYKLAALGLQDALGVSTIDADKLLDAQRPHDERTYSGALAIMRFLGITHDNVIVLATNNPDKLGAVEGAGYSVVRNPILVPPTERTAVHLAAKAEVLGHQLDGDQVGLGLNVAGGGLAGPL